MPPFNTGLITVMRASVSLTIMTPLSPPDYCTTTVSVTNEWRLSVMRSRVNAKIVIAFEPRLAHITY